ncbi:MAG: hypothetical protein ACHQVS_01220 [Candidatus Babeliales bacterium]
MNIRFTTFLITLCMLLGASSTHAVFYKLEEWDKDAADGKDIVICLSDMHGDYENQKITDKQREDIIVAAQDRQATLIVEDLYECSGVLRESVEASNAQEEPLKRQMRERSGNSCIPISPLMGITKACNNRSIKCINVEFRHYLSPDICYGEVLLRGKNGQDQTMLKPAERIEPTQGPYPRLKEVITELRGVLTEVSSYNDAKLKDYYASTLSADDMNILNHILSTIEYNIAQDGKKNVMCYEKTFSHVTRRILEEELKNNASDVARNLDKSYDALSNVLECRIAHHIANSKAKVIFVCAGAVHIKKISQVLKRLGYKASKTKGVEVSPKQYLEDRVREQLKNTIDIADYFRDKQPRPVLQQPKRFSYWRIFAAVAVVATLSYLGYQYWRQPGVACRA